MPDPIEALRRRYETAHDDELRFIAAQGGLTEEAKVLLDRELARRGIRDVQAYKETLAREEMLREQELKRKLEWREKVDRLTPRVAVAIFLLLFLGGAYRLFIEGNNRDGVGIMMASVLGLLLFLVYHYFRRFIRFLMSP